MILSILYVLTFLTAVVSIALIKKSEKKLNIISELTTSFVTVVCFDAICALIMTVVKIPVFLPTVMVCNIVLSIAVFIFVRKTGMQEVYFSYADLVFTILIGVIIGMVCNHVFNGLTIGYNSGDSATHFTFAMGVIRNRSISAMFFNALYNALVIETLSPFLKASHYYIGMIIADTFTLFILTELVYIIISLRLSKTKDKFIAFVITILCLFGYPIYSYVVGGFVYLTCALMMVCYILYFLVNYIDKEMNERYCLLFMALSGGCLAFTYMLYVPFVFAGVIITLFILKLKESQGAQKAKVIRMFVISCIFVGTAMCVVMAMYLKAHGKPIGLASALRFFSGALKNSGAIYSRIFSDFLIFFPVLIVTFWSTYKGKKTSCGIFVTAFCAFTILFLLMCMKGFASGYYYYKLYFLLWILCWICVGDIMFNNEYALIIKASYFVTVLFICITSFFRIEDKIYIKSDVLAHHEGFTEDAKIYAYNYNYLTKDYNSWWLSDDDMQALEYAVDENPDEKCALVLEYEGDIRNTIASRWYAAITGNVGWTLTNMEHDDFVNEVKGKGYSILVLYKDSEYIINNEKWFENLAVLLENNTVKVVSTDGLQ